MKIKYCELSAVSLRSNGGWFDTRAIFDDDDVVWTPFVFFVWLPIASGNTVREYVTWLINAIMFCLPLSAKAYWLRK